MCLSVLQTVSGSGSSRYNQLITAGRRFWDILSLQVCNGDDKVIKLFTTLSCQLSAHITVTSAAHTPAHMMQGAC